MPVRRWRRRGRFALGRQCDHRSGDAGNRTHGRFRLGSDVFPGPGLPASTLIEKNTLPSLAVIADNTLDSVSAMPRGETTLAKASRTCCCVTLNAYLPTFGRDR